MAGQRRSEPRGRDGGGARRVGGVALALSLLVTLLPACSGGDLTIVFAGSSPDRLTLDGFEYQRLA